jgi:ubiquitin carboxyl-terminal hydrolase 4/11/15
MHKKATKRMELYRLPKILILHLKRFKTNKVFNIGQTFFSGGSSKIGTYVEFPGPDEELDMTNYCAGNTEKKKIAYELIGVSNHFGGLGGGHYTAYAKNHFSQKWYDYNDQHVSFAG